jgi:arylsulfatase A-like enzyme
VSCSTPADAHSRSRSAGLAAAAVAAIVALIGCADRPPDGAPPRPAGPPDVVVFLVDTLRADRLGIHGYDRRPTSPRLDALAAEAVVFDNAYAPSPWTLPTVSSLATSTFPCEHGVVDDRRQLPASLSTLAERLAAAGYLTAGLYGNAYAGPSFGLDRGFASYTFSRQNGAAKVGPLLELAAGDGRPLLLYVHNMEPHGGERFRGPAQPGFLPAVKPERRAELLGSFNAYRKLTRVDFARGQALGTTDNTAAQQRELDSMTAHFVEHDVLYDAAVRLADERFGEILDLLRGRDRWPNTVVVFLSDHGEELGEHGGWQHDQSVYEELIRVPLVIRFPGGLGAGTRRHEVVSLADVAPTVLALAGVGANREGLRGRDLARLVADGPGPGETGPVVVAMRDNRKKFFAPWKASRGDLNLAVRDGELKAIVNVEIGTVELYDLAADPGETVDLATRRPEDAARLAGFAAEEWLAGCAGGAAGAGDADLDAATVERLRALGYVD